MWSLCDRTPATGRLEIYMPVAYPACMQTVVETPVYLNAAKDIFSEGEREKIVLSIASDPKGGDVMPGTGDIANVALAMQAQESAVVRESFTYMVVRIFRSS
jgi:hypothetical protein